MRIGRRDFLRLAGAAVPALAYPAWADYPARPVRLVVGIAAGGSQDTVGRLMAQWLSARTGQQFVVENRPGAAGNIATEAVIRAPADGYTLFLANTSNAINATLYDKLAFDFLRDVTPVAGIARAAGIMVVATSVPATTIPEFVAYAKANNVTMASGGIGNVTHMQGELFKAMTGAPMLHVPYRGEALAITDMLGGQVQVLFAGLPAAIEQVRAGGLRALGLTTAQRSSLLPDVPAIAEFVPGYEASPWYGLVGPRGTAAEIVDTLNAEINAGLADPGVTARFAALGLTPRPGTPADFAAFVADETAKWARVVKLSGAKAD